MLQDVFIRDHNVVFMHAHFKFRWSSQVKWLGLIAKTLLWSFYYRKQKPECFETVNCKLNIVIQFHPCAVLFAQWKLDYRASGLKVKTTLSKSDLNQCVDFSGRCHLVSCIILRDLSRVWQQCEVFLSNIGHTHNRKAHSRATLQKSSVNFLNLPYPQEGGWFA